MENTKRYTVGVLIGYHVYEGSHPTPFAFPLIHGMQAAARDKNINLMVACGVIRGAALNLHRSAWPEPDPEMDFVPVGPWNTDGLVFIGPLRSEARIRYAQKLRDGGFPVVVLGNDAGPPAIVVDNEGGIRQVLEHLVGHGHKEIALIAGDEQDAGDSMARLNAYREGVREFGLSGDPRLMEFGQHWETGGYDAMRRIQQSGVKFSAVMCSNDLSALGAMRALREAGIRIPWDVAVAGFDDILESLAQVPPLTSVHYPLFETGYRTLLLLHKRITQGPGGVPDLTRITTRLVARQSCGCLPDVVAKSAGGADPNRIQADPASRGFKDELTHWMLEALLMEYPQSHGEDFFPLCERLADSFFRSLEDEDFAHFQSSLTEILQRVEMTDDESAQLWQSAVSVLRQAAYSVLDGKGDAARTRCAEDLLHQARMMLSESVDRRYTRLQARRTDLDESIGLLTARLISSPDEDQVYSALREDLPRVGVRTCHIVLFEPQGEDPVAVSLLHSVEKDAPTLRFETRHFPPPGLYPADEPFNLALLPLFSQEEEMGYVAFDGGNLDPLATLVRQLSSSIKNAQLHAKVLELSLRDGLTEVHNRRFFEIMLQKETERSRRYKRDLAVIMIDIDYFKRYNDAYGHPAGDEALREIARCIEQGARRGLDVVTRYGGEEFAIILPETDEGGAQIVAENVRTRVAGNPKFLRPTTVSLGIASLRGEQLQSQMLVEQADLAMYQAKSQGRNRSVVFEDWMREAEHTPKGGGNAEA
ncbi:MAG: GGDEF domain-containing protein [Anaerolineales bacterium]|nr:GGDEF domain-containing protein [Anaerolineales bacterium]